MLGLIRGAAILLVAFICFGPGSIAIGVKILTSLNDPPTCNGREMHPGDECQSHTSKGNVEIKTYDDVKARETARPRAEQPS